MVGTKSGMGWTDIVAVFQNGQRRRQGNEHRQADKVEKSSPFLSSPFESFGVDVGGTGVGSSTEKV